LFETAWGFAKSIAYWTARGFKTTTQEQYEERRAICRSGPHGKCPSGQLVVTLGMVERCGKCKCVVALKAGLVQNDGKSDCPLGHWPAIELAAESAGDEDQSEPLEDCRIKLVTREPAPFESAPSETAVDLTERTVCLTILKGLGDSMCFRSALMHLARFRPRWKVDVLTHVYHRSLFQGLCERVLEQPPDHSQYDVLHQPGFMRPRQCYVKVPCNTTQLFLLSILGVTPSAELSTYGQLSPSDQEVEYADRWLAPYGNVVLIHQRGRSFPTAKNPPGSTWGQLTQKVRDMGYTPVVVNFDGNAELHGAVSLSAGNYHQPQHGTSLAALISRCTLFVGVDSGPLHVAGATATPTIGVWLNHHPAHSYNIADNVTHLVPRNHVQFLPRKNRTFGGRVFDDHYRYRIYDDLGGDLASTAERLLSAGGPSPDGELVRVDGSWLRRRWKAEDLYIWREIFEQDDYRVRQLGWRPQCVIDIGAHCGFFTQLASQLWPSAALIAVEPAEENVAVAHRNCPRASIIQAACTYDPEPIHLEVSLGTKEHTGGCRVSQLGRVVPRVTMDEILSKTDCHDILLKLDCEGGEFSIIEHCQQMHRIRTIVGEWHDRNRFIKLVRRKLPDWKLTIYRDHEIGLFRLDRPCSP
jgi:FkbM family methyltransferase